MYAYICRDAYICRQDLVLHYRAAGRAEDAMALESGNHSVEVCEFNVVASLKGIRFRVTLASCVREWAPTWEHDAVYGDSAASYGGHLLLTWCADGQRHFYGHFNLLLPDAAGHVKIPVMPRAGDTIVPGTAGPAMPVSARSLAGGATPSAAGPASQRSLAGGATPIASPDHSDLEDSLTLQHFPSIPHSCDDACCSPITEQTACLLEVGQLILVHCWPSAMLIRRTYI